MRGKQTRWSTRNVWVGVVTLLLCMSPDLFPSPAYAAEPNAEALYAARCASCHELGFLAPTREQMKRLSAEEIEAALWHGTMQEHANGLTRPERLILARMLGSSETMPTRNPGVRWCQRRGNPRTDARWSGWSIDNRLQRHVADVSLSTKRAKGMSLAWAHPFPVYSAFSGAGNQAAYADGTVYTGNLNHWVYALDAERGCAVWAHRAVGRVRSNVAIEDDLLVFADLLANVYGVDAKTGALRWRQRVDWAPGARVTGNLTVDGGMVFVPVSSFEEVQAMKMDLPCCTFRGSVVALDAATGAIRWKTYTIDRHAEYLGENDMGQGRYGPSGVPVWSGIAVDRARGVIYVGNGNQFTEPPVEESDAVMALAIEDGRKVWVKNLAPEQMGGQDIYHLACEAWWDPERRNCSPENPEGHGDRDIGAPPMLVTRQDGKDVVVAGSKDGMLYALDPDADGAVLWNLRVGQGGEVGGIEYGIASDGERVYAPVVDMNADGASNGSLTAVDLISGQAVWRVENVDAVCAGKTSPPCGTAFITPPTVAGEVVFAGLIDGTLRAYARSDGREVWRYDTARDYEGVNGLQGRGGSLGNGGPVVLGDRLFINTGFSILNVGLPGNALLAFKIPR